MTSLRAAGGLIACAALLISCGPGPMLPDAYVEPLPGTYENVTAIFMRSCSFNSCHGGAGAGAAHLNFRTAIANGTLLDELVNQPACQYDLMPLVTPGDPSQSWLYFKMTAPHMGSAIVFTPDPSWDHNGLVPNGSGVYPASTCPLTSHGNIVFGEIMPMGTMAGATIRPDQLATIRMWIEDGAPGP